MPALSPVVLVTGAGGQIGAELLSLGTRGPLRFVGRSRAQLDITRPDAVAAALAETGCGLVVNAAAYTAVDRAETERDAAAAVNENGAAVLAEACRRRGIPLVHLSTDYVFDGTKDGPYVETDAVAPLNVYGATKAAGERAIRDILPAHVILRTAWVFGRHGGNFVRTILRLGRQRPRLDIVDDQWGCPTPAAEVAAALARVAEALLVEGARSYGTYHFAGGEVTTWYRFAEAIRDEAAPFGGPFARLVPTTSAARPSPARRPANSVLDCRRFAASFGPPPPAWRDRLPAVVGALWPETLDTA